MEPRGIRTDDDDRRPPMSGSRRRASQKCQKHLLGLAANYGRFVEQGAHRVALMPDLEKDAAWTRRERNPGAQRSNEPSTNPRRR